MSNTPTEGGVPTSRMISETDGGSGVAPVGQLSTASYRQTLENRQEAIDGELAANAKTIKTLQVKNAALRDERRVNSRVLNAIKGPAPKGSKAAAKP